ncbi:ribosome recycling factor [Denitrovibrio acetiphilus DSM 12809]|uniref:Ribosome-recycling factor n=1 Tax=Denitrovibrio acetiphilus (strain DSM 12809 / NBRC 114555 / N2460) TaxID=522772 RepID=D4H3Y3_DENA2|nr:ribosome recycling factor [Denitrovibrio acetiphilus]ADD67294.1 ribosome recycling factor [Denitrovibrio acetiphilus DSM 12809]
MPDSVMKDMKDKMDKTISHFKDELKTIRTGRASVAMFDGVTVDYYGTPTPLSGVASLNAPEPRLITIQPWDMSIIGAIEKAIQNSNMGFNPSNDGKIIRIPVPQLTEERRKEIVKLVKKMAEDNKVAIRNLRREGNDKIKKLEKDKEISEDDSKKFVADIQDVTNDFIKKVDEVTAAKEKEVMEI